MPTYEYIARTSGGEQVAGRLDADNEPAAVRSLDDRGLFPVHVTERAPVRRGLRKSSVRLREVGILYGQLGDLLQAGVPLLQAMDTLSSAVPNPELARVLRRVRDGLAEGATLAEAMGEHPAVFASLHIAMVRAGERGGFLEDVLGNLAGFVERQDELRNKVIGAMLYPLVIVTVGAIILLVVLIGLVPRFKPLLAAVSKPLPTRVLFAVSDLLTEHLLLAGAVVFLAVMGVRAFVRSPFGRRAWDRWRLRIPIFGSMVRTVSITRFCRILGTLLTNGVPIIEALVISKDATGCTLLAEAVARAAESVRAGERLAHPLRESKLFPAEIVEMIGVAEESNRLEKVLLQIADTVERRANRQVDQVVRLIEPLILVALAGMIGFVAFGLLYPIFTISEAMS